MRTVCNLRGNKPDIYVFCWYAEVIPTLLTHTSFSNATASFFTLSIILLLEEGR